LRRADICYAAVSMKNGATGTKNESWEPVVYLDKLCGLVVAAGVGHLLATYAPVANRIVWVIAGIALAIKIVLHLL